MTNVVKREAGTKRPINPDAKRMGERLRVVREEARLTQAEVANRLGLTEQGYAAYEQGRARLIATDLRDVARALGVTLDYLSLKLGLVSPERVQPSAPIRVGAHRFLQVVQGATVDAGGFGWLPTDQGVMVEEDFARGKNLVPVRVTGDCMEPEIRAGDVVIVDLSNIKPRPGDYVVVVTDQAEVMIKRFEPDANGPLLVDNKGRLVRPNGAKVEGVVVLLQRVMP